MLNSHNELVCLTRQYGQVVWVKKLACDPEVTAKVIWTGPLVAGGKLYLVGAQGTILVMNPADGALLTTHQLEAPFSFPPIVAGGIMYLITDTGTVIAFKGN